MRVRVALAIALLLAVGALALDMSGRAVRIAGSDHTNPAAFVATLPSRGTLCQPSMTLPASAQSVEVLVGTYGRPVPSIAGEFLDATGRTVAAGRLAAGAREGYVRVPLSYPHGATVEGTLCLALGRTTHTVVLGGEVFPPGAVSEHVDGSPQGGRIDVMYLRPGRESWWQLLPALDERMGLGKATFFGDWTLPALALALAGVWIAAVRLLVRELRA